ncbi:GntR family transcriptional regulator [Alicyclobacillus fastidiosus]|uniref:GntR family transcriptional regulator n=1 Tax=Alicyclobacillus fastidiosus TaxID=392011 RepID=A0ABY6ZML5_9BACL|nr:GntR family transcriptional regulator [Alicyclobacillus fastidiosus]WAH43205.1 GntR family transcriptional regulator [Alicyclobacillus fastidiosus]GMA65238.1 GntR family transcriptional regulator [Alicyclobacillus fastidiosus]
MKPIQRAVPLVNQVYEHLRGAILSGTLKPGEKIVETKLAGELQVSRSPVREAIRLLANEQLLKEQNGNISVFVPTIHDFQEISALRLAVEPAAAAMAARRFEAPDVQALQTSLEANIEETKHCLAVGDMEGIIPLNNEFHRVIWTCGGNGRFVRIMENVSALIQYYCSLVLDINQQQTNILQEHTDIYLALKAGDPVEAQNAMYRHINKDQQVIERYAASSDGFNVEFPPAGVALYKEGELS